MKATRLRALSCRHLRCHSARRRTLMFFRRMHISLARPVRSSCPAALYWDFSVFISCLMLWILTALWFFFWFSNHSAAMLTMIVVIACSFLSASPFAIASRICSTSSSNCFQSKVNASCRPFDPPPVRLDARGISLQHLEVLGTMGWLRAWHLLRLTRCNTCALCCFCSQQAFHPRSLDVLAYFTACTLLAHSRLSVAWVCYCCIHPTEVLILPPSRAPLGVFFH